VRNAVESLVEHTTYTNFEVVIVLDEASEQELGHDLRILDTRVRVVQDNRPFNFSGSCNLGSVFAIGDVLLFLNDDTEIIQGDWIQRLVMYAQQPDIGPVGAKLLYADERIQHAGIWSRHGGPGHRYPGFRRDHPGHMGSLFTAQNCMGVTGACLAVERHKFEQVGGFSLSFPLNFNDVDLCLKLFSRGFRSVVDCGTEVVHLESASRNPSVKPGEYELLRDRWSEFLDQDFWDNPNHTGHGVQEFPATSESLLQTWEAIDREGVCGARVWDTRTNTTSILTR
jgi:GT2 family glycosyltransferase